MNRVKAIRKLRDLSQVELARRIGVTRQTIHRIEKQGQNPTLDLCLKLAWALNTDLNSLFWYEPDKTGPIRAYHKN